MAGTMKSKMEGMVNEEVLKRKGRGWRYLLMCTFNH